MGTRGGLAEMELTITVSLNTCRDCMHRDHSGSFTKGGARLICGHSDACQERVSKEQFRAEYPVYKKDSLENDGSWQWKHHWIHRVLDTDGQTNELVADIPEWCPLKHGSRYWV